MDYYDDKQASMQALDADDQCTLASCAMNALQLRAKGFEEPQGLLSLNSSEEELMEWHNNYYGREPGADISAANYRLIMSNISAQQQAILALWNRTLDLEKDVNALVQQVEHDSGLKVADYLALAQEADMSSREQSKGNQPREAHVRKWIRDLPAFFLVQVLQICCVGIKHVCLHFA